MIRILSALLLAALAFYIIWYLPAWCFSAMIFLLVLVCLWEFGRMFFPDRNERGFIIAAGVSVVCAVLKTPEWLGLILVANTFILALMIMHRSQELSQAASRLGLAVLSQVYIAIALPMWCLVRELHFGKSWILLALVPALLTDTFGLVFGKLWGKKKFAPLVSPNKTWMGFFGALLGALLGVVVVWYFTFQELVPNWHLPLLALAICLTAPLGDLIESMLKRSAGVKDSSGLIPGHGGMLDRMDALLFTGPLIYVYAQLFV